MERVEPPALGRVACRGDDCLRDDEAAEEHVAEPIGRFAQPGLLARAGSHGEEIERLGDQRVDVGLGVGFGHRPEPRDPSGAMRMVLRVEGMSRCAGIVRECAPAR